MSFRTVAGSGLWLKCLNQQRDRFFVIAFHYHSERGNDVKIESGVVKLTQMTSTKPAVVTLGLAINSPVMKL